MLGLSPASLGLTGGSHPANLGLAFVGKLRKTVCCQLYTAGCTFLVGAPALPKSGEHRRPLLQRGKGRTGTHYTSLTTHIPPPTTETHTRHRHAHTLRASTQQACLPTTLLYQQTLLEVGLYLHSKACTHHFLAQGPSPTVNHSNCSRAVVVGPTLPTGSEEEQIYSFYLRAGALIK